MGALAPGWTRGAAVSGVSRLMPLVGVDLLIRDELDRTLLAWRGDAAMFQASPCVRSLPSHLPRKILVNTSVTSGRYAPDIQDSIRKLTTSLGFLQMTFAPAFCSSSREP